MGDLYEVRIHLRHAVNGVELRHRIRFGLLVVLRCALRLADVNDKESDIESTGAHVLQIHLPGCVQRVHGRCREIERNVVMAVDCDDSVVDGLSAGAKRLVGLSARPRGQ